MALWLISPLCVPNLHQRTCVASVNYVHRASRVPCECPQVTRSCCREHACVGFRSPQSVPTIYLHFVHLPWRYVSSNRWLFKLLLSIVPFFHAFKSSQSPCLARWGSPPHFTDGEAGSVSWPESQSKNKSQPGWRGPGDRTGVEGLLGGCPTHRAGLEGLLFQLSAKGSP